MLFANGIRESSSAGRKMCTLELSGLISSLRRVYERLIIQDLVT